MFALITSITEGQRKQYQRLVEDATKRAAEIALNKVDPDKDGLQRLFEYGDEFQSAILEVIITKTRELSTSNQFADEEVESSYGYLSGYKPKSITEQTNILRQLFPGIGYANEKLVGQSLPSNAEGYFAIPRWDKIASTYGVAVPKVLGLIKKTSNGKFYNYREGQLGPKYLRQSAKTVNAFEKLGDEQKDYNILIVPAQFGIRHRGKSVRRAREVMTASEFCLGAFANGIMLLTHPERLQQYNDLWIDCAGDEFYLDADGKFAHAPYFSFYGDEVRFGTSWVVHAFGNYGSASGFVPQ